MGWKGRKGWWQTDRTVFFFVFSLSLFSAYMANVTRIAMVPAAVKGSDGLTEVQAQAVVVVHTE